MRRLRRKFERMHLKAPVPSFRELEERDAALAKLVRWATIAIASYSPYVITILIVFMASHRSRRSRWTL